MVRPGGLELPTFWFVVTRCTHTVWLSHLNRLLQINALGYRTLSGFRRNFNQNSPKSMRRLKPD